MDLFSPLSKLDRDSLVVGASGFGIMAAVTLGIRQVAGLPLLWVLPIVVTLVAIGFYVLIRAIDASVQRTTIAWNKSTAERDDPVLGLIRYLPCRNGWESERYFEPARATVEIHIDAPESAPLDLPRQLYQEIEARYRFLAPEINAALTSFAGDGAAPNTAPEFRLDRLTISSTDENSGGWTAEFSRTDLEDFMSYYVELQNWRIAEVWGAD